MKNNTLQLTYVSTSIPFCFAHVPGAKRSGIEGTVALLIVLFVVVTDPNRSHIALVEFQHPLTVAIIDVTQPASLDQLAFGVIDILIHTIFMGHAAVGVEVESAAACLCNGMRFGGAVGISVPIFAGDVAGGWIMAGIACIDLSVVGTRTRDDQQTVHGIIDEGLYILLPCSVNDAEDVDNGVIAVGAAFRSSSSSLVRESTNCHGIKSLPSSPLQGTYIRHCRI